MNNIIENVVFDLDGTLIDSNLISLKTLQKAIEKVENKIIPINELDIILGLSDFDALKTLGVKKQAECYLTWREYSEELNNEKLVFPEIVYMLTTLKDLGVNLGVVTSREKIRYYDNSTIMKNLNSFFDIVVTSDSTEKHKPLPDPLLKWCELSNVMPQQTIYIGDTEYDYLCASAAGTKFGLAAWGVHQNFKTELVFSYPNQIITYIERCSK